jgi:cyclophilin family peptidyl-prolyl cis-trans isomerase
MLHPVRYSPGSQDRGCQPRQAPSARALGSFAVAAMAAVLTLGACGSSGSPSTTSRSAQASATEARTSTTSETTSNTEAASRSAAEAAAAAIPTPGCRHVPPPPSRAGEQIAAPSGHLDPARTYTVTLDTNCGPIVIRLAVKEAPKIAETFAYLTEHGYYNQLTFHRIVPGFVIQGGDPNGNGTGGPSWEVVEPPPANVHYTKGTVAMAKGASAPAGAAGSQFFIVTGAAVRLSPVYALVGHVISGESNVEAIARIPTGAGPEGGEPSHPRVPVVIEKATLSVH